MMNQMMMNMNMINSMNMMMANINNIFKNEVTIKVKLENNKTIYIKCFKDDKVSILKEKCNEIKGTLTSNYKIISSNLNIKDIIQIYGDCIDEATGIKNIHFQNTKGIFTHLSLDDNCPVGIAIIYYLIKSKLTDGISNLRKGLISFVYVSTLLRIEDSTPIKKIFGCGPDPLVIVNDLNNLPSG